MQMSTVKRMPDLEVKVTIDTSEAKKELSELEQAIDRIVEKSNEVLPCLKNLAVTDFRMEMKQKSPALLLAENGIYSAADTEKKKYKYYPFPSKTSIGIQKLILSLKRGHHCRNLTKIEAVLIQKHFHKKQLKTATEVV